MSYGVFSLNINSENNKIVSCKAYSDMLDPTFPADVENALLNTEFTFSSIAAKLCVISPYSEELIQAISEAFHS